MAFVVLAVVLIAVIAATVVLLLRRSKHTEIEPFVEDEAIVPSHTVRVLHDQAELEDALQRAAVTAQHIAAEIAARRFSRISPVAGAAPVTSLDTARQQTAVS